VLGHQLIEWTTREDPAPVEDGHTGTQLLHLGEVVGGVHDRATLLGGQATDRFEQA
jgi:hypothetical protein